MKFWPEKGRRGFLVWRYLLRRDDAQQAPWSKEGIKRIKALGLKLEVQRKFALPLDLPISLGNLLKLFGLVTNKLISHLWLVTSLPNKVLSS